jgi:putative SOS response-associated peptidase YedK
MRLPSSLATTSRRRSQSPRYGRPASRPVASSRCSTGVWCPPGRRSARAETLAEKPSFRVGFRRRRCLVLADGYYEWQRSGGRKRPFFIRLASGEPFAMAAIWERWTDRVSGEALESCAIVTTAAAASVAQIHDRMPVILPPALHAQWLDGASQSVEKLEPLLQPCHAPLLTCHPVSLRVNNARNQGADLIEPVEQAEPLQPGEGFGF